MSGWLAGNLIIFIAAMWLGFWGSGKPAEGGHGIGLIALGLLGIWAAWVIIGSIVLLIITFGFQTTL
jgi:hypothetical protein